MTNLTPEKEAELRLREFGWAPGAYMIQCIDCKSDGWVAGEGCDKRAIRCRACAQKARDAALPPPVPAEGAETAEAYNARFDPANEAGQEVFGDGWKCGWMFARYDGIWDDEAEEAYTREHDGVAMGEAWDAHRSAFFKRMPLAAVERPTQAPQDVAGLVEGDEAGWLIEETWSGYVHYVHKDFNCAKWAEETRKNDTARRNGVTPRYPAVLITKDVEQAMRFPTKEAAELWQSMQPKWLRSAQYQIREHMWPALRASPISREPADMRRVVEALGFEPDNHHNALRCPYCNPDHLTFAADNNHKALVEALNVAAQLAEQIIHGNATPHGGAKLIMDHSRDALAAFQSRQEGKQP